MVDLGKVMITPKGTYDGETPYERLDLVEHNGSSYICIQDETQGKEPGAEGSETYWQLHGKGGSGIMSDVSMKDTNDLLGSGANSDTNGQTFLDKVSEKILNDLISKGMISGTQINDSEHVPSSGLVYSMQDSITKNASNITKLLNLDTGGLSHNGIYRGKDLGAIGSVEDTEAFISEHKISTSEFEDLYLGDKITINDGTYNKPWLVSGFNSEMNRGYTDYIKTPHIALIPETSLFNSKMNEAADTTGGYKGSAMHTTTLPGVDTNLQKALGEHLLKRRVLLSNAINKDNLSMAGNGWKGASSGWEWCDAYSTLLSEVQVYGTTVFSSSYFDIGEADQQLPIFRFINHVQFARVAFWLRSVASATNFCGADANGGADSAAATNEYAVRPLILLG